MKVKITNEKALNSIKALKEIYKDSEVDKNGKKIREELNILVSFKILNIIESFNNNVKIFEETKDKLIKKYGETLKDDKNVIKVTEENELKYYTELSELQNLEIEFECSPIKLEDISVINISPSALSSLDWLIEELNK